MLNVGLFPGVFAALNPSFQILYFHSFPIQRVLLVVGFGQYMFQPFEIFRIELDSFEKFVEIIFSPIVLLLVLPVISLANNIAAQKVISIWTFAGVNL